MFSFRRGWLGLALGRGANLMLTPQLVTTGADVLPRVAQLPTILCMQSIDSNCSWMTVRICRYLGPDYGDERKGPSEAVMAAQIPYLAKESFPMCMQASPPP